MPTQIAAIMALTTYASPAIQLMPLSSPLRSIWFRPARTIRFIAHENPNYLIFVLPVLAGFLTLPSFALFGGDDDLFLGYAISSLISGGPLVELLKVFVGAYLIRITGVWLGGNAATANLQTAIAWGNAPIVVLTVMGFVALIWASVHNEFADDPLHWGQSTPVLMVGWAMVAVQIIAVVWSLVILVRGIAAIQGFSTGRAALNALMAWLLATAFFVACVILFGFADQLSVLFFAGINELFTVHLSE
ncbi:MAG: YIP1 family protein [Pseudomonadota bacterium]